MLLPFDSDLVVTTRFDPETARIADRHYSRQKPGTPQFMPNGRALVIRDRAATLVFGWSWQAIRDDGQHGYNCTIFRNESNRLSSQVILECEQIAIHHWGPGRMFTYINPAKVRSTNPGFCFLMAGWMRAGVSKRGLILLAKERD